MPKVTIDVTTTPDEQEKVFQAMQVLLRGEATAKQLSISTIAKQAHMNANRVRYVVDDLVENGRVLRVMTKAYNERYIRYGYLIKSGESVQS